MAEASTAQGVPVFFYEGRYMERVIADLMNLLDDDAAEWERNHLIDLILAPSDEQAVRSTFFTIAGVTGATIQCVAIRPITDDGASLRALQKVMASAGTMSSARLCAATVGCFWGSSPSRGPR